MIDSIDLRKVLGLVPGHDPVERPTPEHWRRVELDLGVCLPEDWKLLLGTLGGGHFGDFTIHNPASSDPRAWFTSADCLEYHDGISWMAERAGLELYPKQNGFLRVGWTTFGCVLLFQTCPVGPPRNTLRWLDLDVSRAYRLEMSACRFLHDFYLGRIRRKWAEECREIIWPEGEPFFTSWPRPVEPSVQQ